MNAPDLQRGFPPRWSNAVEGIVWLPRLAAKVRAHDEFLKAAQLSYAQLIAIVRASADDAAVLAGIAAASPDAIERLRLWSLEMPVRRRTMLRVLDLDDGYDRPKWLNVPIAAANALLGPLIGLARIVRPLKA
jgi:hypothetical protein